MQTAGMQTTEPETRPGSTRSSFWETQCERRAVVRRLELERSAMVVGHHARGGETDARVFEPRARGDERLEDALAELFGNARAVVGDPDQDLPILVGHLDANGTAPDAGERLLRVGDQIEDGLLNLHAVAVDDEEGLGRVEPDGQPRARNRIRAERDGARDDVAQVRAAAQVGPFARERQDVGHGARRPGALRADPLAALDELVRQPGPTM